MRCPTCDGRGSVPVKEMTIRPKSAREFFRKYGMVHAYGDPVHPMTVCPDCWGARIINCCDGLVVSPDAQY